MGLGNLGALDVTKITDDQLIAHLENKANLSNKVVYGLAMAEAARRGYDVSGFKAFMAAPAAPAPAAKSGGVPVAKIAIFAGVALAGIFLVRKFKGK